jgi:hypothetical protein
VRYLASYLHEASRRLQIIIFTHDDRLWTELQARGANPTHLRLKRATDEPSRVTVRDTTRPAKSMLDRLDVVLSDRQQLGTERATTAMTLALCRQALDTEVTSQIEILGRRADESEETIARDIRAAYTTQEKMRLLDRYVRRTKLEPLNLNSFRDTLAALNAGTHGDLAKIGSQQDLARWVRETRRMCDLIDKVTH